MLTTGESSRFWLIDRIGEEIQRRVQNSGPLIVAIDDAHWTDELSALALRMLVPGLAGPPVPWLLTRRSIVFDTDLAFGHDLTREAIYNDLSGPVRSVLHAAAAAVIFSHGRSQAETAEHLVRSGRPPTARTIAEMREGAAQIAHGPPGTAADLLMRALRLVEDDGPARPLLVADAVRLLPAVGRLTEARTLAESALERRPATQDESAIRLGMADALKHAGLNADVVECARRGLAVDGIPLGHRAQLLAVQAHGLLHVNDPEGADAAGAEAIRIGTDAGEHSAVVWALVARSVAARSSAALHTAVDRAREAVELTTAVGGDARHRHPRLWLARSLVSLDRFDEANAVYAAGQREADRLGTAWSQPLWHFYRADLRLVTGRLTDAEAEAEAGLRVARRLSAMQLSVPLLALLARVALLRDDLGAAGDHVRQAETLVAAGITVGPGELTFAVALLQEALGRPKAALDAMTEVYRDPRAALMFLSTNAGAAPQLVRIALAAGAPAEAAAISEAARRLADLNPEVASAVGSALHADGLLTASRDRLRAGAVRLRASKRRIDLAAALEDLAAAERQTGRRKAAHSALEESLDHYTACAATRGVRRVCRQLSVPDRPAQAHPWSTLTASELRVIRLVTKGLTNRETADRLYLSPHTVDSHLRHSFTKLGVNTRVELTRRFLEQETAEPEPA